MTDSRVLLHRSDTHCADGRPVFESESGTTYVVFRHADDRTECAHEIPGVQDARDNHARPL